MTDYSATPFVKKLGIKEGFKVAFVNAPENFLAELGPLPADVALTNSPRRSCDLILRFAKTEPELTKCFARLSSRLVSNGMLWAAWPKKSSGVATNLSFEVVQRIGLGSGLVDTKICAINDVWSGLRFVIRLKDRHAGIL